jgi:hypothetical protein
MPVLSITPASSQVPLRCTPQRNHARCGSTPTDGKVGRSTHAAYASSKLIESSHVSGDTLAHAIALVQGAASDLAGDLRHLGERHAADAEVYHVAHMLASRCEQQLERLAPHQEREEEAPESQGRRESSSLTERLRRTTSAVLSRHELSGTMLLDDLQDIYPSTHCAELAWVILVQAAKAARDQELLTVAQRGCEEAERRWKWVRTRVKGSRAAGPRCRHATGHPMPASVTRHDTRCALCVGMDLSPGPGDTYRFALRGQSIDVTDVPTGKYRLFTATSIRRVGFHEASTQNNRTWIGALTSFAELQHPSASERGGADPRAKTVARGSQFPARRRASPLQLLEPFAVALAPP